MVRTTILISSLCLRNVNIKLKYWKKISIIIVNQCAWKLSGGLTSVANREKYYLTGSLFLRDMVRCFLPLLSSYKK